MNFYEGFLNDRKTLIKKYPEWNSLNISEEFLNIPNPQLLLGFAGYLKYKLKESTNVFFRGERTLHKTLVPSLFRSKDNEVISPERLTLRFLAYSSLIERTQTLFNAYRFRKEDVNPILQHYGIKTTWIDLVDNLFIAIWFSNTNSTEEYSYVKFVGNDWNNSILEISDLRIDHSSLSLRPHCQHGISASKNIISWDEFNIDFSSNVLATVRIPNNELFKLNNSIFSDDFMYPSIEFDNTFKYLKMDKFQKLLLSITKKFGLDHGELGYIK
jgi:FRG domain